jgi:glucose/arabinose dehydrogenase
LRQVGEGAVQEGASVRAGRRRLVALAAGLVVLLFPGAVPVSSHAASGTQPPPFMGGEGKSATGGAAAASAAVLPSGFTDTTVFSGLTNPTNVRFASDGRVFVAEKSGLLVVFDSLADQTPTVVADLSKEVDDYWDRGLLGLALDPNFPTSPYVYLLYTADAPPGGTIPTWNDSCPSPPGPTTDGCVVSGKIVRIQLSGDTMTGSPQVLVSDQWCQQFPSHSIGDLNFGPDGDLYASAGDGASFDYVDYGQSGGSTGSPTRKNPCGDPPAGAGGVETAPTAEGGALRAQSFRRPSGQPVVLNGSVIRINPATGLAAAGNPNSGSADANAKRIVAYGFRNPFRFTFRPGTSELWVGDVGWDTWEEIDRVTSPTSSPSLDFGWPCYEGVGAQPGYQSTSLNLCTGLYSAGTATAPYYTYNHGNSVVSGDGCPTANGSSITGDAFYTAGSYPAAYNGALIFADHTRNCIWAMLAGSNGLPDPSSIQLLVGGAANPVDVEAGPGGDIFYADLEGGTIQRISYSGSSSGTTCGAGQFEAKYFNNMTLSGTPVVDQCEAAVNHDWGTGSPAPGVNADGFSASWDGSFTFAAGTYMFSATGDDGIRVYVDGTKVIDGWKDQSATTYTAPVTLTAGTHAVRVEYYDDTVDAVAEVSWQATSSGGGGGTCPGQFEAKYFNNMTLSGTPVVDRCEAAINNDWGTGSPAPGVNADGFSASWDGSFTFAAGMYQFSATGDDGIRVYVDGTKVIDGWKDQSATTYTAPLTLTAGTHAVRVEYYDDTVDAVAKVSWQAATTTTNAPPTAVVDTPASTLTYAVGDSISFSGHATDAEDGTVPASSLTWTLIIHHCPSPGNCHTHTVQTWPGVASGAFNAPDHGYPSYLELQLTATDSGGASTTSSVQLSPKTVNLTFASNPPGLSIAVNSAAAVTPFVVTVIMKSSNSISASTPQTLGGTSYTFSSWSDAGAASHNIVAPASATTYTATYAGQTAAAAPANTSPPVVSGIARTGSTLTTTKGSWTGTQPITYTYQWLSCDSAGNNCTAISGATLATYSVRSADHGHRLRSRVTAQNSVTSVSAMSSPTATVPVR